MHFALQFFPTRVKQHAVLRKLPRQVKEFEIVGLQVHVNKKPPEHDALAA
ncbi:MAG: hypothetical protein WB775_06085 [Burkholderiaceae bacterium]